MQAITLISSSIESIHPQENGKEATSDELAVHMDMPEDKIRKVLKIAKELL